MNTVLVTGANRGIGLSLVEQLLSKGWQVHATYRNEDSADKLKSLGNKGDLICHRLDITDYAAVSSLVDVLPSLDLLINNAGYYGPKGYGFGQTDEEGNCSPTRYRQLMKNMYRLSMQQQTLAMRSLATRFSMSH